MMKDTKYIELSYPRCKDQAKYIKVDLMDVRAADGIRISYDFDRDGWVIEQASNFAWKGLSMEECDRDWKEVAFVQAWGREQEGNKLHL